MFESSSSRRSSLKYSVPPKRILAERLLRSVAARNSVETAPSVALLTSQLRSVASRFVGVRLSGAPVVSRHAVNLPRQYASSLEGVRGILTRMFQSLKGTARAKQVQRMAERFASSSTSVRPGLVVSVASPEVVSLRVALPSSRSRPGNSRLN
jgi:hypothetical protein